MPPTGAGRLILCATPIGNLGDASRRLGEVLAEVDLVFAEDTRRSTVLLDSLGVKKPLQSYFVGNEAVRARELEDLLSMGKAVALLTDAGTPAISDPGLSAVAAARAAGAAVSVIPGPSAVTAALAVSGLPSDRFVFEGFLPRKGRERDRRLAGLTAETRTVVIFVATRQLLTDLRALAERVPDRPLCIARELTKVFEEIQWTTPLEASTEWASRPVKGEFTLVLGGAGPENADPDAAVVKALLAIDQGQTMAEAVRRVAGQLGVSRRELYQRVLARTRETTPGR
ncbi:MAG TPA: 16S rRNA (cytidine(1402)-2'-O)-methyltransferase [Acidimicrobiia bacterium]|nr:16S rRNA (cytidine(1402)-2'-O)-methyltransferase [Acidimicrobiia bacterium]